MSVVVDTKVTFMSIAIHMNKELHALRARW
jgi:hypothetical protein